MYASYAWIVVFIVAVIVAVVVIPMRHQRHDKHDSCDLFLCAAVAKVKPERPTHTHTHRPTHIVWFKMLKSKYQPSQWARRLQRLFAVAATWDKPRRSQATTISTRNRMQFHLKFFRLQVAEKHKGKTKSHLELCCIPQQNEMHWNYIYIWLHTFENNECN